MADQQTELSELKRINWGECFGFVALFRTFRLALHPSKLLLAFAGLVVTLVFGLVLDLIWPAAHEPYPNEISAYVHVRDFDSYRALHEQRHGEKLRTTGVFREFAGFEMKSFLRLCESVLNLDLFAGLRYAATPRTISAETYAGGLGELPSIIPPLGALAYLVLMIQGVQWLIAEHWFYAILFLVGFIAIWSVAGGALCRVAALDAARDEKPPLRQALRFAGRKFLSFAGAPLMVLALVIVFGIALFLGGLLGSIPYAGELLTTPFLFIGLIVGAIITALLIGWVTGGSLMWPTIAVEGSDAFDAISRSLNYVYSRPWRATLYGIITLVYGAICYLFVRLFVWLALVTTRWFVSLGMFATSRDLAEGANKVDVMWPAPSFGNLAVWPPTLHLDHMQGWDLLGACLIWFWATLFVLFMYAFVVSFFYSGCTLIYLLLRREVDVTDMDDVYVEELEEAPPEAPAAPPEAAPAPTAEPAAGPAPAEPPPASQTPPPEGGAESPPANP